MTRKSLEQIGYGVLREAHRISTEGNPEWRTGVFKVWKYDPYQGIASLSVQTAEGWKAVGKYYRMFGEDRFDVGDRIEMEYSVNHPFGRVFGFIRRVKRNTPTSKLSDIESTERGN